jgi:hypothetical protein
MRERRSACRLRPSASHALLLDRAIWSKSLTPDHFVTAIRRYFAKIRQGLRSGDPYEEMNSRFWQLSPADRFS